MRRDLDLIRKIVLAMEESDGTRMLKIDGYSAEQVGYHSYLIIDAGLAKGIEMTTLDDGLPKWELSYLTSAGHDFADAAREEGTWRTATGIVREKASGITLDVLRQVLVSVIKRTIGLP